MNDEEYDDYDDDREYDDVCFSDCCNCSNGICNDFCGSYKYYTENNVLKSDRDSDEPFLGIEIELETTDHEFCGIADTIKQYHRDMDHDTLYGLMWWTEDGSLDSGVEIKHQPSTLGFFIKHKIEFIDLFSRLTNYTSAENTCGIHIHLSRQQCTNEQIRTMLQLFFNNEDYVYSISDRQSRSQMNYFAQNTPDKLHDFNSDGRTSKYSAIHAMQKTVEIRIFGSTLDVDMLYAHLEFVHALWAYTRDHDSTDINDFHDWIQGQYKTYWVKDQPMLFENAIEPSPYEYAHLIHQLEDLNLVPNNS